MRSTKEQSGIYQSGTDHTFTSIQPTSVSSTETFNTLWSRFTVPWFSYLGGCRAGCSVAMVTLWVYVVGGDLGWGAFDNVDV